MKKFFVFIALSLVITLTVSTTTGCYGSFSLTSKLYKWNGQVGDKYVNSLVFWVFSILPVYSATCFIDIAVLNVIEFWTGSNPVAMNEGQELNKTFVNGAKEYNAHIKNGILTIKQTKGPEAGKQISLIWDKENKIWFLRDDSGTQKIASLDNDIVSLYLPDGNVVTKKLFN